MKSIWTSLRKPLSRIDQLYYESKGYADSLGDLVANLHYVTGKVDTEAVLVLVSNRSFGWYLRMLQSVRVVAQTPIVVIASSNQLAELLIKLSASEKRRRLIIERKLYFKLYAQLGGGEFEQDIIVI